MLFESKVLILLIVFTLQTKQKHQDRTYAKSIDGNRKLSLSSSNRMLQPNGDGVNNSDYKFFDDNGFIENDNYFYKYYKLGQHSSILIAIHNPNHTSCQNQEQNKWFIVDDKEFNVNQRQQDYKIQLQHRSSSMIIQFHKDCAENTTINFYLYFQQPPIYDLLQKITFIPIFVTREIYCESFPNSVSEDLKIKNDKKLLTFCSSNSNILEQTYELSNHSSIEILFKVFAKQDNFQVKIHLDGIEDNTRLQAQIVKIKVDGSTDYYFSQIAIPEFQHNKKTFKISIEVSISQVFAISDFDIILRHVIIQEKIFLNCQVIIENLCLMCNNGFEVDQVTKECVPICGDKLIVLNEECDDGNNDPNDGCYKCKFQCQPLCTKCLFGICKEYRQNQTDYQYPYLQIFEGIPSGQYYYDTTFNLYKNICGDKQISGYEECDDGNDIQYDGCHQCKFSCPINCVLCEFGICKQFQEVLIEKITDNKCSVLQISTLDGFYYDFVYDICESKCGDGILAENEDCEDDNDIPHDGCYNCKFSCSLLCSVCQKGICTKCVQGYKLKQQKCISSCGDGFVTGQEVCDDGNHIKFDGCDLCEQSCQIQCLNCSGSKCFECLEGWQLINGNCFQICGDNQLAQTSFEQCDDFNDQNCFDCKFVCPQYCLKCFHPSECQLCEEGFIIQVGICVPYCGDGILVQQFEQCDDKNNEIFDGCFNCLFQCSIGCNQCIGINICQVCDETEYYLDKNTHTCMSLSQVIPIDNNEIDHFCYSLFSLNNRVCGQCGDGIFQGEIEECDDGNQISGDGCSEICITEYHYVCLSKENQPSQCTFSERPKFKLSKQSSQRNSLQSVILTFNQKVSLYEKLKIEDLLILRVLPEGQFNITTIPIVELNTNLSQSEYQLNIQFLSSLQNPLLSVEFRDDVQIINEFQIELIEKTQSISLGSPFVLSESSQKKFISLVQFNDAMIYGILCVSGFSILLGNFDIFLNTLELLQQLSYLQYMTYDFPSHLQEFFKIYKKIQISSLLNSLGIDKLFEKLNNGKIIISKQQTNSQTDTLNTYFLINSKACLIAFLGSLLTYFICSGICSIKFQNLILNFLQRQNFQLQRYQKIYNKFRKVSNICFKIKKGYFYTGLFTVYYSCFHQLNFSIFLQFPEYEFDSPFKILNSIISIISSILFLAVSYYCFEYTLSMNRKQNQWFYFFDGINKHFWQSQFKTLQLLKISCYIAIIVFLMDCPELQSYSLSSLSLIFVLYVCTFIPLKSKLETSKLIIKELLFSGLTGTFYAYSFNLNDDLLLLAGWIHIGMLSTILCSNLFIDTIKQIQSLKLAYEKEQRIKNLLQEKKYYVNPLQQFILNNSKPQKEQIKGFK